jgi:hypothetical protein
LAAAPNAAASGTINIIGTEYSVDTISHVKIGPGTTTTHLELINAAGSKLQVFYHTVDRKAAPVKMRVVCAKDMVAGRERPSAMAARKSVDGTLYFAGTNGDFYSTSGTATNNTSTVGTPTTSCTVEGEVYKTSNSQQQFIVTTDDKFIINRINYYTGTATIGSKYTLFKGVNVSSPNNGVTLYTPKYWGSTNQTSYTDNCAEVTAKLADGETFEAGKKFKIVITSEPNSTGDTTIPSDGFVLFGRSTATSGNTAAKDFVNSLHVGDVVTMDHTCLVNGMKVVPQNIVSGNPKIAGGGLTLDTEGDRTDAKDLHPRTALGFSLTGDSVIMMVVDGRSSISAGVRTSALADIMRYAKAWEAVNLDGGGSSTLYTSALGVLNACSDGSERSVGNGIFATIDGDVSSDRSIGEISFKDWKITLKPGETYTPVFYGYNQAGVMISKALTGVQLSCSADLGSISSDGKTLTANLPGTYVLNAKYGTRYTASIIAQVEGESGIPTVAGNNTNAKVSVANGIITVSGLDNAHSWAVYNTTGGLIASGQAYDTPVAIDASDMASGIYIVTIDTADGRFSSKVIL